MKNSFRWKKRVFSSTYNIYSNGQVIGKLKDRIFSQAADGEINGKSYTFKTKGFFKQKTKIIDNKDNTIIGEITYNNWMTKAELSIHDQKSKWKYDNLWNTKWSIYKPDDIKIKYAGSSSKGQIDSNAKADLLLLSGLFITNYYWQMSIAVMIAVFVPIWMTVLN